MIKEKNSYAKKYFQLTIVEMEMQQIAESIVRVTKRVHRRRLIQKLSVIMNEAKQNRPAILKLRKSCNSYVAEIDDYVYLVEFDQMICLEDLWIDGETLRYLNSLRTNILVSSTKFDSIHLTDQ